MKERTYRCLICLDEGIVVVFNPAFIHEYSGQWAHDVSEGASEVDLYQRIHRFWRLRPDYPRLGALTHAAICKCDCKRACTQRAELDKFRRGERINKEKRNVAPAAGWQWDQLAAPLWPGPVDSAIYLSLDEFYSGRLF